MTTKIISWNVDGLRSLMRTSDFELVLEQESPDIIALQETKLSGEMEVGDLTDYHVTENNSTKAGYAGVLTASMTPPKSIKVPKEWRGRIIISEYKSFYLVNVYVPNSGRGFSNKKLRKEWDRFLKQTLVSLDRRKPVIACGDFNVAHQEIDLAKPQQNRNKTAGFSDWEREDFTDLLGDKFIDVFRCMFPDDQVFTFWTKRFKNTNIGWRLDYFIISKRLARHVDDCYMLHGLSGSDHGPIILVGKFKT